MQDKLKLNSELVVDLIIKQKAQVYVCGKNKLAKGVKDQLVKMLKDGNSFRTEQDALKFIQDMRVTILATMRNILFENVV